MTFFSSDDEITGLAGAFFNGSLPLSKWNKATQMAITFYFAVRFPGKMAFDIMSERIPSLWAGLLSERRRSEIDKSIDCWLARAKEFAEIYYNLDELSALTNLFMATHWAHDMPYPQLFDNSFHNAITERLKMPDVSSSLDARNSGRDLMSV
jgi:hypothetical protein